MDLSPIIFDKLEFLRYSRDGEHYKLSSTTDHMIFDLTYDEYDVSWSKWCFTNSDCPENVSILISSMNDFRNDLCHVAKLAKATYYITAYKNLNLVRDRLHPDLIPNIVILINNLRHPHYLETVKI